MLRLWSLIICFLMVLPVISTASEIDENDFGTYVLINKDHAPTEVFLRLSRVKDKWLVEGKLPGSEWKN